MQLPGTAARRAVAGTALGQSWEHCSNPLTCTGLAPDVAQDVDGSPDQTPPPSTEMRQNNTFRREMLPAEKTARLPGCQQGASGLQSQVKHRRLVQSGLHSQSSEAARQAGRGSSRVGAGGPFQMVATYWSQGLSAGSGSVTLPSLPSHPAIARACCLPFLNPSGHRLPVPHVCVFAFSHFAVCLSLGDSAVTTVLCQWLCTSARELSLPTLVAFGGSRSVPSQAEKTV